MGDSGINQFFKKHLSKLLKKLQPFHQKLKLQESGIHPGLVQTCTHKHTSCEHAEHKDNKTTLNYKL